MKELHTLEDLTQDPHNANKGSERGTAAIEDSLEKVGAARSIVVDCEGRILAGNHVHQKAVERGLGMIVVDTTGHDLVVVRRLDVDAHEDPKLAREIAYRDNRAGELNLTWDAEQLTADMENNVLPSGLFASKELTKLLDQVESAGVPLASDAAQAAKTWHVVVECANEAEQTELIEKLTTDGLKCRTM